MSTKSSKKSPAAQSLEKRLKRIHKKDLMHPVFTMRSPKKRKPSKLNPELHDPIITHNTNLPAQDSRR